MATIEQLKAKGIQYYYHCPFCNKHAFYLQEKFSRGDKIHVNDVWDSDLKHTILGQPMCSNCKTVIPQLKSDNIRLIPELALPLQMKLQNMSDELMKRRIAATLIIERTRLYLERLKEYQKQLAEGAPQEQLKDIDKEISDQGDRDG